MFAIKRTDELAAWLDGLKDRLTRVRLNRRLDRAMVGHLGDVKPVGNGVFEMREHFGPGWRLYYVKRGETLIVMLGGGDSRLRKPTLPRPCDVQPPLRNHP